MKTNQNTTGINGCLSTSRMMLELWRRSCDSLNEEELEWFSGATEQAENLARDLDEVLIGVGCLVGSDYSDENRNKCLSGNFQSCHDVSTSLFLVAKNLDNIQGLIHIGTSAEYRLSQLKGDTDT